MTKHKTSRRKRSQKGGGLFNWFSGETEPNAPTSTSSWGNWFSGKASGAVSGASNALTNATTSITQGATDATNAATNALNSNVNLTDSTSNEPPYTEVSTGVPTEVSTGYIGGRRKRRGRTMKGGRIMKGGKGGLGLTYYATPVSGLNVAKPTYWIGPNTNQYIKGGSKKRHRKGCKSRKSRKSRKHRKH